MFPHSPNPHIAKLSNSKQIHPNQSKKTKAPINGAFKVYSSELIRPLRIRMHLGSSLQHTTIRKPRR